jgi:O-antigen/teichoic acid export membrane protein
MVLSIGTSIRRFSKNTILTNSLYLMLASGFAAFFGFVFWIIVAHSFESHTVGLATTLLSMSGLIALLGLAGFDTVFVRYLPKTEQRDEHISSGLIVSGIVAAILSIIFCLMIPVISPKLGFVDHRLLFVVIFIVSTVFATWNTLTNAVFIAYRRTSFVLIINMIFSAIKMFLPFTIHSGGPMTIFIFAGIAQLINVLLSIAVMVKRFNYKPSLVIRVDILKKVFKFGSAAYLSNIFNLLPDSALPLIVIDKLGASAAAYFYIAFTIANLLYTIAFSTTQVLFAELAHYEDDLVLHIRKGLKVVAILMTPAIIVLFVFAPFILGLFGNNYSAGATGLLRIMIMSSIAIALYSAMGVTFKITKNLRAMLATTATNAIVIIGLSLYFTSLWGLVGVGWAWFVGCFSSVFVGGVFIYLNLKRYVSS